MTEPTQAQIEEAGVFAEAFQLTHKNWDVFEDKAMAKIISHIRREARNAALEEAENYTFANQAAYGIRALKDQP